MPSGHGNAVLRKLPLCVNIAERIICVDQQKVLAVVHAIRAWQCCFEVVSAHVLSVHNPLSCLQC